MAPPRPFRLSAALAALAFAVVYAGFIIEAFIHSAAPKLAPPVLSIAVLLYLLFTRKIARSDGLGPLALPVTVLVAAVGAPVFAAHAHIALAMPLAKIQEGRDPVFIDAAKVAIGVVVAAIPLTGLAARSLLRSSLGALIPPLRITARAVLAVALALVAASAVSPRTSLSRWIASLPVVATAPVLQIADKDERTPAGDLAIVRRCEERAPCSAWLLRRREKPGREPDVVSNEQIVLRRDAIHDLWILDGSTGGEPRFLDRAGTRAAFRGKDLTRVDVRPSLLVGAIAPPFGWTLVAALGVILAIRNLVRRRDPQRKLDELLAAEAGTLGEDGWITLENGDARVRSRGEVAPGPVTVVLAAASAGPAYRSDGVREADRVLPGARADLLDEARLALATLDARAIAVTAVAAAPLAVAWLEGLR